MKYSLPLDAHEQRRVAVAAACDPRTVRAFLEGRALRPTCSARIERALRELRIELVVRGEAETSVTIAQEAPDAPERCG